MSNPGTPGRGASFASGGRGGGGFSRQASGVGGATPKSQVSRQDSGFGTVKGSQSRGRQNSTGQKQQPPARSNTTATGGGGLEPQATTMDFRDSALRLPCPDQHVTPCKVGHVLFFERHQMNDGWVLRIAVLQRGKLFIFAGNEAQAFDWEPVHFFDLEGWSFNFAWTFEMIKGRRKVALECQMKEQGGGETKRRRFMAFHTRHEASSWLYCLEASAAFRTYMNGVGDAGQNPHPGVLDYHDMLMGRLPVLDLSGRSVKAPECNRICRLILADWRLQEVAVAQLSVGLCASLSLRSLKLSRNFLRANGTRVVCDALSRAPYLIELSLENCEILPMGGQSLVGLCSSAPRLLYLNVGGNQMGTFVMSKCHQHLFSKGFTQMRQSESTVYSELGRTHRDRLSDDDAFEMDDVLDSAEKLKGGEDVALAEWDEFSLRLRRWKARVATSILNPPHWEEGKVKRRTGEGQETEDEEGADGTQGGTRKGIDTVDKEGGWQDEDRTETKRGERSRGSIRGREKSGGTDAASSADGSSIQPPSDILRGACGSRRWYAFFRDMGRSLGCMDVGMLERARQLQDLTRLFPYDSTVDSLTLKWPKESEKRKAEEKGDRQRIEREEQERMLSDRALEIAEKIEGATGLSELTDLVALGRRVPMPHPRLLEMNLENAKAVMTTAKDAEDILNSRSENLEHATTSYLRSTNHPYLRSAHLRTACLLSPLFETESNGETGENAPPFSRLFSSLLSLRSPEYAFGASPENDEIIRATGSPMGILTEGLKRRLMTGRQVLRWQYGVDTGQWNGWVAPWWSNDIRRVMWMLGRDTAEMGGDRGQAETEEKTEPLDHFTDLRDRSDPSTTKHTKADITQALTVLGAEAEVAAVELFSLVLIAGGDKKAKRDRLKRTDFNSVAYEAKPTDDELNWHDHMCKFVDRVRFLGRSDPEEAARLVEEVYVQVSSILREVEGNTEDVPEELKFCYGIFRCRDLFDPTGIDRDDLMSLFTWQMREAEDWAPPDADLLSAFARPRYLPGETMKMAKKGDEKAVAEVVHFCMWQLRSGVFECNVAEDQYGASCFRASLRGDGGTQIVTVGVKAKVVRGQVPSGCRFDPLPHGSPLLVCLKAKRLLICSVSSGLEAEDEAEQIVMERERKKFEIPLDLIAEVNSTDDTVDILFFVPTFNPVSIFKELITPLITPADRLQRISLSCHRAVELASVITDLQKILIFDEEKRIGGCTASLPLAREMETRNGNGKGALLPATSLALVREGLQSLTESLLEVAGMIQSIDSLLGTVKFPDKPAEDAAPPEPLQDDTSSALLLPEAAALDRLEKIVGNMRLGVRSELNTILNLYYRMDLEPLFTVDIGNVIRSFQAVLAEVLREALNAFMETGEREKREDLELLLKVGAEIDSFVEVPQAAVAELSK
uniref:Uncharacterized protein n=1 Tax=Chromera velia CCMP2878 TaxID=1169474 RepID=A0A0G4HFR7_9ALVE|eukprot:Cvel_987.t1-p1 / transcript=Cvel_987.t1 / gene=Cvel_987 / organism=Chromera_velia_CCMP2878 / gene_product=hypothetical protein / transcript_product=hypothetical protein / location=Cvel_scaffold32:35779-51162(+) / protein_length=1411 / sequence_SO=supercontig / SO=protein_coding / is_pseudo=false